MRLAAEGLVGDGANGAGLIQDDDSAAASKVRWPLERVQGQQNDCATAPAVGDRIECDRIRVREREGARGLFIIIIRISIGLGSGAADLKAGPANTMAGPRASGRWQLERVATLKCNFKNFQSAQSGLKKSSRAEANNGSDGI